MDRGISISSVVQAGALGRARLVEAGLPISMLHDLVSDRRVTLEDLEAIFSRDDMRGRYGRDDRNLSIDASDRLARLLMILTLATDVFGNERDALHWLRQAKRRFDGRSPISLLRTHAGAQLVEDVLEQARHGIAA